MSKNVEADTASVPPLPQQKLTSNDRQPQSTIQTEPGSGLPATSTQKASESSGGNNSVFTPDLHISCDKLKELMQLSPAGQLRIINATFKPNQDCYMEHCQGRIPGADFLDLGIVRDMTAPYPHTIPSEAHFTKMMVTLGIKKSQTIVIYETGNGWFATRAAFVMRIHGHPNVHILDGGFKKWQAEENTVEKDEDADYEADFDYNLEADQVYTYEQMKAAVGDDSVQIIEQRPSALTNKTGNFAGALHVPTLTCLSPEGGTLSADEITAVFTNKGVDVTKPMVFTCRSGMTATMGLACAIKARFAGPLYLYDGSWTEWGSKKAEEAQAAQ